MEYKSLIGSCDDHNLIKECLFCVWFYKKGAKLMVSLWIFVVKQLLLSRIYVEESLAELIKCCWIERRDRWLITQCINNRTVRTQVWNVLLHHIFVEMGSSTHKGQVEWAVGAKPRSTPIYALCGPLNQSPHGPVPSPSITPCPGWPGFN